MNIRNISEGQIIKNYRELCVLLDIKEKTGKAKIYQMRELERYFKFNKSDGQSLIIEKIYKNELSKIDNRKLGNRSIYVEDISVQLLNYLAEHKNDRIFVNDDKRTFLTHKEIFEITGMINSKYLPAKKSIEAYISECPTNIEIKDMKEFYIRTEAKMREMLKSALKVLEDNFIILVDKRHMVFDGTEDRITTDKEESKILSIKNKILNNMLSENVTQKNLGKLFFIGRLPEFYRNVDEEVAKQMGLHKLQYGFLIGCTDNLEENLDSYKKEYDELIKFRNSLNGKFATFVNKDAKKKYLKMKENYENELKKFMQMIDKDEYEQPTPPSKDWEYNQRYLTDDLIRLP
jgi:hypothetical protein